MELGSTAKLRTLAHILELVASLYKDKEVRETPIRFASRSHHAVGC